MTAPQSKIRYSQVALVRTIHNRLVEARQDAVLQVVPLYQRRAAEAVPFLQEAEQIVLDAGVDLRKDQALVLLGRLMRPRIPSGGMAAILGVRQAVTSLTLAERDETKSFPDARAFVMAVISAATAAQNRDEVKRWEWAMGALNKLGALQTVNVEALWRASEHAVKSSIPFDTVATKR